MKKRTGLVVPVLLITGLALACNLPLLTQEERAPQGNDQPTTTATEGAVPDEPAFPTETPEADGTVSGEVCYPSEPPLPPLTLYFMNTLSGEVTSFEHTDGTGAYRVGLPPGAYFAFAWRTGFELGGAYSEAVLCGLGVECVDHSLIEFLVHPSVETAGIDLCDWYGEPTDLPFIPESAEDAGPAPTATDPPPPGGVSLNCDGTYQRVRITDEGINGKTISVDNWDGSAWLNAWNISSGDANLAQMLDEAGYYDFGGCEKLVVVPIRYSGPQLWFELGVYSWNGTGMTNEYFNEGYYGEWLKLGDDLQFKEAATLGTVNNGPLGACEWVTLVHTWDGANFTQTGSNIEPVADCTVTVP